MRICSGLIAHRPSLELIEALRQQLKQQQQSKVQQLGIRGQLMSPRQHALPELSECDSDDCGDENEDPGDETREVSEAFLGVNFYRPG